jgi:hypothetical protein
MRSFFAVFIARRRGRTQPEREHTFGVGWCQRKPTNPSQIAAESLTLDELTER